MAWLSITLCIVATSLITTNVFTSCDARFVKVFKSLSWDPREDLDYINPADISTYSSFDYYLAPQPSADSIHLGPTEPPKASISMVSAPPEHAAMPPAHGHHKGHPRFALWCVARPTVPEPMLQKAMDYACGFGADCKSILPNGPCFMPNSLFSHASYAFNSFWQKTKNNGGTCDFGATAMLITVDPSFNGCHFVYD